MIMPDTALHYARVGAAVPLLRVADCAYNSGQIVDCIRIGEAMGVRILAFPELSITGYTCGDLFFQSLLHREAGEALERIRRETRRVEMLVAVGMPLRLDSRMFNCAVLLHRGKVIAAVPKTFLPNSNEFYEERWFSSSLDLLSDRVELCGQSVPIGRNLVFPCPGIPELVVGVEVCEDLWCPIPPSSSQAMEGANVILNLSASNELVAKADYRRSLVSGQSARLIAAYVYASAGTGESTTDLVFGGHSLICENGAVLEEAPPFSPTPGLIWADVDVELLMNNRRSTSSFGARLQDTVSCRCRPVAVPLDPDHGLPLRRRVSPTPFVPADDGERDRRCGEIFAIQRGGLARRLAPSGANRAVVAVSGGLDSTLALLCTARAFDDLGRSRREILGVTMPGFGTTGRTYRNALDLMEALGVERREISIREACLQHFADIGHDPAVHDVTYENTQARERMQIAMDLANMEGGIVVGTGDLSELALGFTTYNGDHMSMYSVNCGVPKTLVRALVDWVARSGQLDESSARILGDILDTPVSPELLPPDSQGEIRQKTEDLVGPYELHDFFLYYMVRHGFSPAKILFLCGEAFGEQYAREEVLRWMRLFYRRFFQQQFKRSCVPDGPKIGTVALSPRGDWRMPSDACARAWLQQVDALAEK